jgi:hypothetical protein
MGKSTELYQICWDLENGKITSNEAHNQILCLFDVIKSVCIAPKGECDRKPKDVCKECYGCKFYQQTVL